MALCKTRTGNDRDACYHTPPKIKPGGPARAGRGDPRQRPDRVERQRAGPGWRGAVSPWAGSSWNGRHQAKRRIESSELGSLFDRVSVPFSRWALVGQNLTKAECTCSLGRLQPKSLMRRNKMPTDAPEQGVGEGCGSSATGPVDPVLEGPHIAPERQVVVPDLGEQVG